MLSKDRLMEVEYEIIYKGVKLVRVGFHDDAGEVLEQNIWDDPKLYRDEDNKRIRIVSIQESEYD